MIRNNGDRVFQMSDSFASFYLKASLVTFPFFRIEKFYVSIVFKILGTQRRTSPRKWRKVQNRQLREKGWIQNNDATECHEYRAPRFHAVLLHQQK